MSKNSKFFIQSIEKKKTLYASIFSKFTLCILRELKPPNKHQFVITIESLRHCFFYCPPNFFNTFFNLKKSHSYPIDQLDEFNANLLNNLTSLAELTNFKRDSSKRSMLVLLLLLLDILPCVLLFVMLLPWHLSKFSRFFLLLFYGSTTHHE